ncbi:MAG: MotA/TolQ/ExbB proton channel family protein [Eubacteriales bacterium]|nr:MotA/TolQ/ExbB proton channel family protein [Eubacteriales bacterium]
MAEQISFASVLWKNFLTYDFLVFLFAIATAAMLLLTLKRANALFNVMNKIVYLPEKDSMRIVDDALKNVREFDVVYLRRKMMASYSLFSNFIMIFPLLGILGTVLSLLPMVTTLGQTQMQANFFSALTSTLWGLVFAIVFKAIDGYVSGRVEDNENAVQLYLQRTGK